MIAFLYCLFFLFFSQTVFANPPALYFDPGAIHETCGVNRLPVAEEEWKFDLNISPFYQHASGARDPYGKKVPLGDRLGKWGMLPLLWGDLDAAPKEFNATNYAILYTLSLQGSDVGGGLSVDEEGFSGELDTDGFYSVPIDYEKKGLRFEMNTSMKSGFGLRIKSGVVDYKQTPTFIDASTIDNVGDDAYVYNFLQNTLMTDTMRSTLLETELGFNLDNCGSVAFEDTLVQFHWTNKFECENGDGQVEIIPYFAAGFWLPTGKRKDPDKLFALPTGHDGFWGVALEAAVSFNFPKTVLFNFGGSLTLFETKSQCLRVPNSKYQSVLYPFKAEMRRTMGPAWNINFSMHAYDVMDNLSVHFDYLFNKHERDSITLKNCSDARRDAFLPEKLECDSMWKSHTMQLGFLYEVSPCLSLGITGQTHISGIKVYKTHTVMGNMKFVF